MVSRWFGVGLGANFGAIFAFIKGVMSFVVNKKPNSFSGIELLDFAFSNISFIVAKSSLLKALDGAPLALLYNETSE